MKICLLGAQGTGKTTLANLFRDRCDIIDGIARNVIAHGGASNKEGNASTQRRIFKDYMKALDESNFFLSTRSIIDVCAYTTYLACHKKVDYYSPFSRGEKMKLVFEAWLQKRRVKRWLEENPDVVICYIPVEFGLVKDGCRSTDAEYQKEIDRIMKELFDELCKEGYINFGYEIKGDLSHRKMSLESIIDVHEI